jgi:2-oxoglutarate dehydrogenase E1 component
MELKKKNRMARPLKQQATIEEVREGKALDSAAASRQQIFDAFRRWGFLAADLDPLGDLLPLEVPELQLAGEAADAARRIYCGKIGAEFMHISDPARRAWIQQRLESEPLPVDRQHLLDRLACAEVFEQVLQTRYLGTKRYSLEGNAAIIPLLDEALETGADRGAAECVLAMSHRGRLTVMVYVVGRSAAEVFSRFEDVDPRSILGGGDVKYHMGATGQFTAHNGQHVGVHLVSNPSHLEAVDPVALGRARAKQTRTGADGFAKVLPILLHGDAAFAGQGILAETLNFEGVDGFNVGGALHVIVNNLLGFTTVPDELHSSRFSSDLAKRLPVPIFHVNSESPEDVLRVARLAVDYRYEFQSPVVIDLIGFRRHGHSEVDDPTITQPRRYRKIQAHQPLWQIYAQRIGADPAPIVARIRAQMDAAQKEGETIEKIPTMRTMPAYWAGYHGGRYNPADNVPTGISSVEISELTAALTTYPRSFAIHPKVKKLLEQRQEMGAGKRPVDFGMAEALAFGSLLREGVPVRLSGQDSKRGTFNQRHAALIDTENEEEYVPLSHVSESQAAFEAYNSTLSEASVLGFEYGFSRDFPEALVLWEAQFGDFANGAQITIDQFIVAGEDKWGLLSGTVMLLPHGYEGQGPEHSSARIERFLQLAAHDNIQICQPSTAAQYFHLLRRQALRKWRKPLVVFTPKSMLRNPVAASSLAEFSRGEFLTVVPEPDVNGATRVLVCTGKIGHELHQERKRIDDTKTAIVFVEQIYPFPEKELSVELARHAGAREIIWVQEEPANMGALAFVIGKIERAAQGRPVLSIKRSAAASPATGSAKAHEMEQRTLLSLAFAST